MGAEVLNVLQMFYFLTEALGDHCFHFPWPALGKSHGISRRAVKAHICDAKMGEYMFLQSCDVNELLLLTDYTASCSCR